jgi:uncharacterized damage-inducible protein DinB
MSDAKVEVYAELFEKAFRATVNAAAEVPESLRFKQVSTGKAHPLWLLGHMTFAADTILNVLTLGGSPLVPKEYRRLFAPEILGGSPITADAAAYPCWDDVLAEYKKVGAAVAERIRNLTDRDLEGGAKGNPPEQYKEFFARLDETLREMLLHDAYHRGQLNLLVKA